jgi:hypothetical protein
MHEVKRNLIKWGTFGRFHNEPLTFIVIKDITDSHLLHIISWIKEHPHAYALSDILATMEDEQAFRTKNYIFV